MAARPPCKITRLNGIPIQMFAISTDTSAHCALASQGMGSVTSPMERSAKLTTP